MPDAIAAPMPHAALCIILPIVKPAAVPRSTVPTMIAQEMVPACFRGSMKLKEVRHYVTGSENNRSTDNNKTT